MKWSWPTLTPQKGKGIDPFLALAWAWILSGILIWIIPPHTPPWHHWGDFALFTCAIGVVIGDYVRKNRTQEKPDDESASDE